MEDAIEVDVDDLLPTLEGELGERREIAETSRVHQDRDGAQLLADRFEHRIDLRPISDVGGVGVLVVRRIEVEGGDPVSVGGQPLGDRPADSGCASGHQSCFLPWGGHREFLSVIRLNINRFRQCRGVRSPRVRRAASIR